MCTSVYIYQRNEISNNYPPPGWDLYCSHTDIPLTYIYLFHVDCHTGGTEAVTFRSQAEADAGVEKIQAEEDKRNEAELAPQSVSTDKGIEPYRFMTRSYSY